MLHGRFGESSGRPYISARVFIPRLGLAGTVSFIFDTGADSSVLMPAEAHIVYGYDIELLIHHPTDNAMRVPSLFGRNIIDRWRVTYDKSVPELVADVLSSDAEFPA